MIPMYEKLFISPGDVIEFRLGDFRARIKVKKVSRWTISEQSLELTANVTESVRLMYEDRKLLSVVKEDRVIRIVRLGIEPSYVKLSLVLNAEKVARLEKFTAGDVRKDYGFIWTWETPRYKPKLTLPVIPGYEWALDLLTPVVPTTVVYDAEVIDLYYEETEEEPTIKIQILPFFVRNVGPTLKWVRA